MLNNKKGLSAIIVTVLLIGLTIIAVGIVWAVINNTLRRGTEGIDFSAKCLDVSVITSSVNCDDPAACIVRLERTGQSSDAIAGVKMVFENATGTRSSSPGDYSGNIEVLGNAEATVDSKIIAPTKIETTVYFKDASGNEQVCTQSSVFEF